MHLVLGIIFIIGSSVKHVQGYFSLYFFSKTEKEKWFVGGKDVFTKPLKGLSKNSTLGHMGAHGGSPQGGDMYPVLPLSPIWSLELFFIGCTSSEKLHFECEASSNHVPGFCFFVCLFF